MSFTQEAYTNPNVMYSNLKDYVSSFGQNNNWPVDYKNNVLKIVENSYNESYSIYKFDTTIINDFLYSFLQEFEDYTIIYTRDNVDSIPKYKKFVNVISELLGTRKFVEETTSISNIAEEQAIETAKQIQKTSDDTFKKLLPYVGIGAILYFVLPRVMK